MAMNPRPRGMNLMSAFNSGGRAAAPRPVTPRPVKPRPVTPAPSTTPPRPVGLGGGPKPPTTPVRPNKVAAQKAAIAAKRPAPTMVRFPGVGQWHNLKLTQKPKSQQKPKPPTTPAPTPPTTPARPNKVAAQKAAIAAKRPLTPRQKMQRAMVRRPPVKRPPKPSRRGGLPAR